MSGLSMPVQAKIKSEQKLPPPARIFALGLGSENSLKNNIF